MLLVQYKPFDLQPTYLESRNPLECIPGDNVRHPQCILQTSYSWQNWHPQKHRLNRVSSVWHAMYHRNLTAYSFIPQCDLTECEYVWNTAQLLGSCKDCEPWPDFIYGCACILISLQRRAHASAANEPIALMTRHQQYMFLCMQPSNTNLQPMNP